MSPTNKFSQASNHSNTIAATYKLIQRSLFGLMSALLVTTLSVAMVSQISVNAISDNISQDPVVLAQQYLDNSQNSVSFTKLKSLESVIQYFITNNFEASNIYAYSSIEVDNQFLDIPFSVDLSKDLNVNQKSFEDSKNRLISNIKLSKTDKQDPQAPTEIDLGDVSLNIKEAQLISDSKLDEIKSKIIEIVINKVSFSAKSNNATIQNFEKSSKKTNIQKKSALSKTKKLNDSKNNIAISDSDIESVTTSKPSQEERNKVLDEAQKTKEGIARRENERFIGETIVKPMKEKAIKEQEAAQKQKAVEIKQLIDQGRQSEIKSEDVYALGEESKKLGLEIVIPTLQPSEADKNKPENQPKVTIDENKAKLYKQDKKVGLIESIINFGSVKASAFSPNYNNTYMYHAKPNTHYGTVLDLYNSNTSNGASIGLWYKNSNNSWNQKFDLYFDDTIRVGGKCLDMSDYNRITQNLDANGVKIHLWDCNGGMSQKWVYDTEGLIRLKGDMTYCIDANSGNANNSIFTYKCGSPSYTEAFRSSEYEMVVYSRKFGGVSPVGHTFIGFVKWNDQNYMSCYDTYTLWNDLDNSLGLGCNDRTSRGSWDNVFINKSGDWNEGLNLTQNNSNPTLLSYWKKNITFNQYNDMVTAGWNPGYNNSTYSILAIGNNCTTYVNSIWNKYVGFSNMNLILPEPNSLYLKLKDTKVYSY